MRKLPNSGQAGGPFNSRKVFTLLFSVVAALLRVDVAAVADGNTTSSGAVLCCWFLLNGHLLAACVGSAVVIGVAVVGMTASKHTPSSLEGAATVAATVLR